MITTTRTRTADGTVKFITSDEAQMINEGTIIRLFGTDERFDVYRTHTTAWGETQLIDYYGEIIRLDSTTRVEIIGHFNLG